MKRIFILLASVGLVSSAYAGMPGDEVVAPSGIDILAPDSVGVWSLGLEALYMEPSNDRFNYTRIGNTFSPTTSPVFSRNDDELVNSTFHLGGTIDLTYLMPGNSRDVKLSYTQLDMDDTSTTRNGINRTATLPFDNVTSPLTTSGSVERASQDDDYQSADLVFGQWLRIGSVIDLHPFGGLRYSNIDDTSKAKYTQVVSLSGSSLSLVDTAKVKNTFEGLGPRAGFDAAWHIGNAFSLVATVGASLLIGDMDTKITEYNRVPGAVLSAPITNTTVKTDLDVDTHIVPELDGRLGLDYLYIWNPSFSTNLQIGYQVVHYFNAIEDDYDDIRTPNNIVSTQDFAYRGPYLRLQFNLV